MLRKSGFIREARREIAKSRNREIAKSRIQRNAARSLLQEGRRGRAGQLSPEPCNCRACDRELRQFDSSSGNCAANEQVSLVSQLSGVHGATSAWRCLQWFEPNARATFPRSLKETSATLRFPACGIPLYDSFARLGPPGPRLHDIRAVPRRRQHHLSAQRRSGGGGEPAAGGAGLSTHRRRPAAAYRGRPGPRRRRHGAPDRAHRQARRRHSGGGGVPGHRPAVRHPAYRRGVLRDGRGALHR